MRQHSRKTSPPDAETHSDVELVDASIQAQLQEEQKGHQRERERERAHQTGEETKKLVPGMVASIYFHGQCL